MRRFWIVGLSLLFFSGVCWADPMGKIRGKVKTPDGKPIEKATITIEFQGEVKQTYTATTNARGEYIHIGIKPGNYRVTATREGYEPAEFSYYDLTITPSDKPVTADFVLKPKAQLAETSGAVRQPPVNQDIQQGISLLNQGKVEEAVVSFQKALQTEPENAILHHNLGVALERAGKKEEAAAHFQQAVRIKPDFAEAYLALGNVYLSERKSDEAVDPLKKASELMPQSYAAFYNLGAAYSNLGKYAEAEAAFRKATEISPREPVAHQQLGLALLGQSKNAEAKAAFQKYLELNPNAADRREIEELMKSL